MGIKYAFIPGKWPSLYLYGIARLKCFQSLRRRAIDDIHMLLENMDQGILDGDRFSPKIHNSNEARKPIKGRSTHGF